MCRPPSKRARHQVGKEGTEAFIHINYPSRKLLFILMAPHFPSDSSSASEDETSVRRQSSLVVPAPLLNPSLQSPDCWINRSAQGSSTSSSASSTLSHGEAKPQPHNQPQPQYKPQRQPLYKPQYQPPPPHQPQHQPPPSHPAAITDIMAHGRIGETVD